MATLQSDVLAGLSSSVAIKGPCLVATTGNITLSGEQTIDGVLTSNSRVLVGSQTDARDNGIYKSSSGAWSRQADFSRNDDVVNGTLVIVAGGSTKAGLWRASISGDMDFGTTAIAFLNALDLSGALSTVAAAATYKTITSADAADALRVLKAGDTMTGPLFISADTPTFSQIETDAGADAKRWRVLPSAGTLFFSAVDDANTVPSHYMQVERSGATITRVRFPNGIVSVDGGQLAFPATQNPSADANTFDDYEEGLWVPAFTSAGATFVYTEQFGQYVKLGKRVELDFRIALSTGNTLTAAATTIAAPFTANSGSSGSVGTGPVSWTGYGSALVIAQIKINGGGSTMNLIGLAAASASIQNVNSNVMANSSSTSGSISFNI